MSTKPRKAPREVHTLASVAIDLAKSPLGARLLDRTGTQQPTVRWAVLVCDHAAALFAEIKKRRASEPPAPAGPGGSVERAWFYGFGGYQGEPDYTGPRRFASLAEAETRWALNYDIAGPFASKKDAVAHLDAWLLANEDDEDDEPKTEGTPS